MAFDYSKKLTNPVDYPTVPQDEQHARQQFQDLFDEIKDAHNSHLAESVHHTVEISRDLSLTGVQTVSGLPNKIPKLIEFVGIVDLTDKVSICNGKYTVYRAGTVWRTDKVGRIAFGDTSTDRTFGTVQNIQEGSFEIDWTHSGAGATGISIIGMVLHYHGGE